MGPCARRWALGLLLPAVLALAGCNAAPGLGGNVEELLRAPQAGARQSAVQRALATHTGGTPQLKYPRGGEENDPMLFVDLDGDGQEEAAVLYVPEGAGGGNVHLAVLEQEGDAWRVASSAEGLSTEVAAVQQCAFLGQGRQLAVGYANSNLTEPYLAVYQYDGSQMTLLYRQAYGQFLAEDVTGDGLDDLIVAGQIGQPGAVSLQFWTLQNDGFRQVQTLAFPEDAVGCEGLYASWYGQRSGVVADLRLSSGNWGCVVLGVQGGHLAFRSQGAGQGETAPATRTVQQLYPQDLTGTGTVYVAQVRRTVALDDAARRLYLVAWYNYLLPEAPLAQFGVYDSGTGLFVRLPTIWENGSVTLEADAQTGAWRMVRAEDGAVLLRVRTAEESQSPGAYEELARRAGSKVLVYFGTGCTVAQRQLVRAGSQYLL